MVNSSCLANALSMDGLKNATVDELQRVSTELKLESVARNTAMSNICIPAKVSEVSVAAPLLALRSAVRNFVPNGKPYTLANYLKRFTTLWARRLAVNASKEKSLPIVDLNAVLAEVKGQRMYEELAKSIPESSVPPADADGHDGSGVLDVVAEMFQSVKVSFTRDEGTIHSTMKTGSLVCHFSFRMNGPDLTLLIDCPVFVPVVWRNKVCAAINAINWKLLVGNFEMDPEDGEVRFRATLPLHGAVATVSQVDCMFGAGYHAIREYGLALVESGLTDHENGWLIARAEREFDPSSSQ